MHELSLAMDVIELAQREAGKNGVSRVEEILIEVGDLSGVEADAFQSALELIVRDTLLENAIIKIVHTSGKGVCNLCKLEFEMKNRIDTCPHCGCFPSEIRGGQEFRVVSLLAE
ncbi:MAG: hydrogenase maturation nickel metallochaperone HypA [Bacteroidetes bacterium]|nr:hydrogenase maturation nickel metallochaperone HypA [Bacteroidota bacterium]